MEVCPLQTVFGAKRLILYFKAAEDEEIRDSSHNVEQYDIDTFVSSQIKVLSQVDDTEKAEAERVLALDNHKSSVSP